MPEVLLKKQISEPAQRNVALLQNDWSHTFNKQADKLKYNKTFFKASILKISLTTVFVTRQSFYNFPRTVETENCIFNSAELLVYSSTVKPGQIIFFTLLCFVQKLGFELIYWFCTDPQTKLIYLSMHLSDAPKLTADAVSWGHSCGFFLFFLFYVCVHNRRGCSSTYGSLFTALLLPSKLS